MAHTSQKKKRENYNTYVILHLAHTSKTKKKKRHKKIAPLPCFCKTSSHIVPLLCHPYINI